MKSSIIKKITFNAILFSLSIVFAFTLIEIVMRVFFPQPLFEALLPSVYVADEVMEYRLKPLVNSRYGFDTNRFGMRDYDHYKLKKPKDTYRILFLGDSFIYSVTTLEKSIPKILEKALKGKNTKVEVFNAGVFGYGTINEYFYLKNYGLKFKPDLVLLGIYAPNDCYDNDKFPNRTAVGGKQVLLSSIENNSMETVEKKVKMMEYLYSFHIVRFLKNVQQLYKNNGVDKLEEAFRVRLSSPKKGCIVNHGAYRFNHKPLRVGACWNKTIDYLQKINDLAHDNSVELGMVLIPDAIQFDTPAAKSLRGFYEKRDEKINYDWDNPQKELMMLAKEHEWKMLNPLPAMREKSKGDYIYYCEDPHLNDAGNEFLANEVADWLLTSQLYDVSKTGSKN